MAPSILEGQMLGKYRVLEQLGRGGMAQVYRAYHPQLDRYVAIKVLRSDLVEEEEFLARFRREARAVAGLRHPNIVNVFDFDVQNEQFFMVMELLEGDTLKVYLNSYRTRGQHIPLGDIVRILLDVLEGLGYAHNEGIVHRDIKPANILLTRRGQAVVSDFGIAQIVGGTQYTVSGALMGTLNYMAPEQGLEGRGDSRSDLYSLGIVFYEMLTGKTPFDADTPLAILMKHLHDPLPLPRKIEPSIPESFERVVLKVLAKQPGDRYQSAEEMAQTLREAAEQSGTAIPEQVFLPTPVRAPEPDVPSSAKVVFSGEERQQIASTQFAADETDRNLDKKLSVDQTDIQRLKRAVNQLLSRISNLQTPEIGLIRAASIGVGALALANICAATAAFATRQIAIYGRGWPMELLLGGILLALVMSATRSLVWLIPVGILIGNGILFSYYSLTGFWYHWTFLWPLEPLLVAGVIFGTLWLIRHKKDYPGLGRPLGYLAAVVAAAWGVVLSIGIALIVVLNILR
jgi:serine/threonine protein kinase